jgi:hypothetical protein
LAPLVTAVGAPPGGPLLDDDEADLDSDADDPIVDVVGNAGTDANSFVHLSSLRCLAKLALFCLSVYRLEHYSLD